MNPRLKAHKFGTQYLLRPSDVVIASYFPISTQVHMGRAIISRGRDAERAEWIASGPFIHSTTACQSIGSLNLNHALFVSQNCNRGRMQTDSSDLGSDALRSCK